jgi:Holliday junction DNA helicase RuvA
LELKDKVQQEAFEQKIETALVAKRSVSADADDLVDALLALGYRRQEAEAAAEIARDEAEGVEQQLKVALKRLQR